MRDMQRNMKRALGCVLLAAMLMLAACALADAPAMGTAVTRDYVQLLETPNDDAAVIMNYYPGVRVEVTEIVSDSVVKVTVGAAGGALSGYMPASLLAYGEESIRREMPMLVRYRSDSLVRLYSTCDRSAERVGEVIDLGSADVLGASDGWLHVKLDKMMEDSAFIDLSQQEVMLIQSDPMDYAYTYPMEGEITIEQAIREGKTYLLEHGRRGSGWNHETCTAEMLDLCEADVRVSYYPALEPPMSFEINFYKPTDADGPQIYAWINVWVKGGEIISFDYGNG